MKINRWIALAMAALLVVGAMGFASYRVFASMYGSSASQDCGTDIEEDDTSETAETEDSDKEECGQQDEGDEVEEVNGQDTADETAPANTGITAAEAQAIVESAILGTGTLNVEFDREGGKDIWEVELDNDMDVKVDASSGEILYSEKRD